VPVTCRDFRQDLSPTRGVRGVRPRRGMQPAGLCGKPSREDGGGDVGHGSAETACRVGPANGAPSGGRDAAKLGPQRRQR